MDNLSGFHPAIQYTISRLANPSLTYEELGRERGISKQAVAKQCQQGLRYLQAYRPDWDKVEEPTPTEACQECCTKRESLIAHLRRQLILSGVKHQLLQFFKEQVLRFMPKFKVTRLPAREKERILQWFEKFQTAGGTIREFARAVDRSPETLARWKDAYAQHGLAGLADKSTRPKHFGHQLPLWIRNHLILLFIQFPSWTPYQYHSYIRHNPATHWYVSLPVIQKLKTMHRQASEQEKERITKRWCFAPGTKAWTMDFTCLLKTDSFKLQCLTISDQRSRFLIYTALYLQTSTENIMAELQELFIKHGKPDLIKVDNGPEFRTECREQLRDLTVYLINSPEYYGQFNGAHERIHRKMKAFLAPFAGHCNLTRLVADLAQFQDEYNYKMPMDSLEGKTPAEIFLGDESFIPKAAEVVTPYEKEGELRMKFTDREGNPARIGVPVIERDLS